MYEGVQGVASVRACHWTICTPAGEHWTLEARLLEIHGGDAFIGCSSPASRYKREVT